MSFQQGLSGLNAASKQLEVIGNNVANANTVGFKQARAEFADVYANSLSGGGGAAIGIGTKLSTVAQQFTQGNITSTSNSLDIAINGGGFFRMSNGGVITYSRNGQFQMDKLGNIVDAEGKQLTGYPADSTGAILNGSPAPLNIDTSDLKPRATTTAVGQINMDSRKSAPAVTPFNPADPTSYSDSTAVTVYDSLGNSHTLVSYFVKETTANIWNVYTTADGIATSATPTAQLTFPASGTGTTPTVGINPVAVAPATNPPTYTSTATASGLFTINFSPLKPPIPPATVPTIPTGAANVSLTMDYSNSTQFGSNFSINSLSQDGYTSGRLAGFNTGADGTILGRYSNGQSKKLGQVVLTNFTNPNGLQSLGGNAWAESATSGQPLPGAPGTSSLGVLQASAVEDSNTDLTAELVNMITAQRFYQANAQTIKTQDAVLQTLVNLR